MFKIALYEKILYTQCNNWIIEQIVHKVLILAFSLSQYPQNL